MFLNTNTSNPPVPNFTFTNTTGMDLIRTGLTNFTFIDRVPAAAKPTSDLGGDNGIKVEAGGAGTLRIEAVSSLDTLFRITEASSTSATVELKSGTLGAKTRFGSGINSLVLQTNPAGGTQVRAACRQPQVFGEPTAPPLPGLSPNWSLHIESLGPNDGITLGGSENAYVAATVHTGAGNDSVLLNQDDDADSVSTVTVDFDPNLGGGLGSGNRLEIGNAGVGDITGVNCVAALARLPGTDPHSITVDSIVVSNGAWIEVPNLPAATPATLVVADEATIGELSLIRDFSQLGENPVASIEAPVDMSNGKIIADGTVTFTGGSSPSVVREFAIAEDLIASTGVVNVQTGADVTVLASSRIDTLNIPGTGVFTLQRPSGTDPQRVLTVERLFMGSNPASPAGLLDLTDNLMIVDYPVTSPLSDITALLTSGYNGGGTNAWQGNGINTSMGNALTRALGYARATDLFINFPASFDGQQIDQTTILVKYTFYGDANLNGMVNLDDFNILADNYDTSGNIWSEGNFNYDANGNVNLDDFNLLAGNYNAGTGGASAFYGPQSTGYTIEELLEHLLNGGGPLTER